MIVYQLPDERTIYDALVEANPGTGLLAGQLFPAIAKALADNELPEHSISLRIHLVSVGILRATNNLDSPSSKFVASKMDDWTHTVIDVSKRIGAPR